MPKHVVHKLQKIESDLKTVVSLYEVVDKSKSNDKSETPKEQDSKQFPKISAPKRMEAIPVFNKFREVPGKPQTPLLDSFKKTNSFIPRSPQGFNSGESVTEEKCTQKKPGSAPSSCSMLSTISESNYIWQESSEKEGSLEQGVLSKAKTSENLNSEWLDSSSTSPAYAMVMTPSKTLETAHEVLAKNNFNASDALSQESVPFCRKEKEAERCGTEKDTTGLAFDVKNGKPQNCEKNKIKARISQSDISGRNPRLSLKKETSLEHTIQWSIPVKSGSVATIKICKPDEDPQMNEPPIVFVTPDEEQKMDPKSSGTELTKLIQNKFSFNKPGLSTENIRGENENKKRLAMKQKLSEKFNYRMKPNENSIGDKTDEKKNWRIFEKDKKQQADGGIQERSNQKRNYTEEIGSTDLRIKELSTIVEKSTQKLEKMKVSKELALDMAKHLKNKNDEIQKSKEELIEKVKILEKTNERLSTEIKEARELKYQLHQKIEGPENSKTKIKENPKAKEVHKEILWFKNKMSGCQKKQNSDVVEKTMKTEEVQKERFVECKKGREILKNKVQALTTENSDLLTKINELQRQLCESQSKEESLQENVHQLKEEFEKQKEQLKIKTETLNETNRELEIIRLNSTELEEQVKMMKKNLDDFDGIQRNLIRKTADCEQQKKEDEEKIKKLQEENERLKGELENEKDALLIKIKIIEDQQETIKQLKEKVEDAKSFVKRNQSLERVLNSEREEKLELQEAVERLKWRKQELKKKVRTLANDFLLAPQEVVKDLQKTQMVLHELENQVQVKQKEWELQLQSLIKQKQQACRVAEFATKKLRETTNEFQKQSDAYKGLQRILAENLVVKQKCSHEGWNKMKNL